MALDSIESIILKNTIFIGTAIKNPRILRGFLHQELILISSFQRLLQRLDRQQHRLKQGHDRCLFH